MQSLVHLRLWYARGPGGWEPGPRRSGSMMMTNGQKSLPSLGFLTVIRDAQHGLFGGYLILNAVGRPLEFHCTAPVRPNRAQEILYGPTLEPYLIGERIGPTLLEKAKARPAVVFTDQLAVMAARAQVATALSLVPIVPAAEVTVPASSAGAGCGAGAIAGSQPEQRAWRPDPPHAGPGGLALHWFEVGSYRVAVDAAFRQDESKLSACWPQFASAIDLLEPFGRIREAIDEARRGATS